jgi:uric acid-xanthine permease
VTKFPIPGSQALFGRVMYVGSGVLSVMGTSFTFLPIFEIGIAQMKADGIDGQDAYGKMLGTAMVCSLLELFFSAIPTRILRKLFPPVVSCVTVILIGVALTGTGMFQTIELVINLQLFRLSNRLGSSDKCRNEILGRRCCLC